MRRFISSCAASSDESSITHCHHAPPAEWVRSKSGSLAPVLKSASPRSNRHRGTESVRTGRALEKAELDQDPDRADDWDEADQHPPAGFIAVVEAFDIDDDGRDQREQREDAAEKPNARFGIVVSGRRIDEGDQNADGGQRQGEPQPKLLPVGPAFRRKIEFL